MFVERRLGQLSIPEEWSCGLAAGASGVFSAHPIDTLRVRQMLHPEVRLGDHAANMLAKEGPQSLFKGICSPMICVGISKAILFGALSKSVSWLDRGDGSCTPTPISHLFLGGVVAGAVVQVIQNPVDRIKCTAQCDMKATAVGVQQEMQIAKAICRVEGMAGLYRGLTINLLSWPVSIGVWFSLNEWLLRRVDKYMGVQSSRSHFSLFWCGAASGTLAWAVSFPGDKAKVTLYEELSKTPTAWKSSNWDLLLPRIRAEGASFFWRGMSGTILRSPIQTGVTMWVYTKCRAMILD
mmetsp:Transcript_36425/g.65913  ORF Transcript_36425/g.65913 Transcript_36425/m.65913 type:complete len:295 (+) Transcript_36425:46-930(+)